MDRDADRREVWITGTATFTSSGCGTDRFWNALLGTKRTNETDTAPRRFPPWTDEPRSGRRLHSDHRLTAHLLAGVSCDLGAFLDGLGDEDREATGVAIGTSFGHLDAYLRFFDSGATRGYQSVNPRHFPYILPNCCAVSLADAYSLWGSNTTVCSGIGAGMDAITSAAEAVRLGDDGIMVAGGADELSEPLEAAIRSAAASAPNDVASIVAPGEATAVLMLQSAASAHRTGRTPLAELMVSGSARTTDWSAAGAATAAAYISAQLGDAGISPDQVDLVFPSIGGVGERTEFESDMLRQVFAKRTEPVALIPVRSVSGECLAAAAPIQCVAASLALNATPAALEGLTTLAPWEDNRSAAPRRRPGPKIALVSSVETDGSITAAILRRLDSP